MFLLCLDYSPYLSRPGRRCMPDVCPMYNMLDKQEFKPSLDTECLVKLSSCTVPLPMQGFLW